MSAFQQNRPVNSAPNPNMKRSQISTPDSTRTNTPSNFGSEGTNSQVHSPRRRRNSDQSVRSTCTIVDPTAPRVLVTGEFLKYSSKLFLLKPNPMASIRPGSIHVSQGITVRHLLP